MRLHHAIRLLLLISFLLPTTATLAKERAAASAALSSSVEFLASDKMEGRGIGTEGLDLAAEYLRDEFEKLGLKTDIVDGTPYQPFTVTTSAKLGEHNSLTLMPGGETKPIELKLGKDYNPLAMGGSARVNLPIAFVGYGISGKRENYDDYAEVDVKGKAVIILRHEPQRNNPHSVFNGTKDSIHAPLNRKVSNAYQHGAAAVLLVSGGIEVENKLLATYRRWEAALAELKKAEEELDEEKFKEHLEAARRGEIEKPPLELLKKHREKVQRLAKDVQKYGDRLEAQYDPLLKLTYGGSNTEWADLPVFHVRREVVNEFIQAAGEKSLEQLEREIDKGPTPQSFVLSNARLTGQADIQREQSEIKNVVAVLEGEGPTADETLVIGAHYDHLGRGGPGSTRPGSKEIHNGADDNASGTAVLLDLARKLATREEPLPRRVVFIAFTGEERGLLGSAHYVRNPLFPLEETVAMLNLDMVGRLTDNKLIAYGSGTAKGFEELLDELNETAGFKLIKKPDGFGPSDHSSFYGKQIPVIALFTGSHKDYHSPDDDFEKLNLEGMQRISDFATQLALHIAEAPERPKYEQVKQTIVSRGGTRPYFGSMPDFSHEGKGYGMSGVAPGSPAEKAGIKPGDVLVEFGENKIGNLMDFDGALRKYKAGDKVKMVVQRKDKEVKLEVTLDPPK